MRKIEIARFDFWRRRFCLVLNAGVYDQIKRHLPTVSIELWLVTVWKDGASAETSHRYLPLLESSNGRRMTLSAVDRVCWNNNQTTNRIINRTAPDEIRLKYLYCPITEAIQFSNHPSGNRYLKSSRFWIEIVYFTFVNVFNSNLLNNSSKKKTTNNCIAVTNIAQNRF